MMLDQYTEKAEAKKRKEQEKQMRKGANKRRAKEEFDDALTVWRKDRDLNIAFTLTKRYDAMQAADKAKKVCKDKSNSISIIYGKGAHDDSDSNIEHEYPPHLRRIASILICLPCASANVERVFSQLKLLYSKRRLQMNPEVVKQLMFLGCNNVLPTFTLKDFN
ncbi:MAG: hAT transposon family protein [Mesoflavibacter sp.]|nr:hAT transposon family protein [Mesoflavibacter sp.]